MKLFSTQQRQAWVVGAGWFVLLLVLAALRPLAVPDEGRYAEIGRWMLVSADWLTPRLDGIPFFHKPPLLHWLEAGAMSALGVSAWVARLVPAVHAALMLGGLYLATRHMAGDKLALRAVWMMGSSLAFLLGGQYVNHDMMVATWISLAIWCLALALAHQPDLQATWARWGFVACALGVMSKMLIGLALPGLVLLLWLAWTRQLNRILKLPWISGLLLFGAIAVPWFVLEQMRYPDLMAYMFGTQQLGRYTGSSFNNAQPWWFYLPVLLVLLFPWAFFALALAWRQWRGRYVLNTISTKWLALAWIGEGAIVLFFSIPHSKIVGYVLPVVPALALLSAVGWEQVMGQRRHEQRWFAALVLLNVGLAVAANVAAARLTAQHSSQDIAVSLACQARADDTVYALGEYPYDLPFYAGLNQPVVVVQDWPTLRQSAGDNWRRELFEGADFDSTAARVLQTPAVLPQAAAVAGHWLVTPNRPPPGTPDPLASGWLPVQHGQAWSLYRSAPKGPETAQDKGLSGCDQHRSNQSPKGWPF